MKKKRNKKYNPIKIKSTLAKSIFHNRFLFFMHEVTEDIKTYDRITFEKSGATLGQIRHIESTRMNHKIQLYLIGEESNGKHKVESEVIQFNTEVLIPEVSNFCYEHQAEMIKDSKMKRIHRVGFVILPNCEELENSEIYKVCSNYNWMRENKKEAIKAYEH